MHKAERPLLTPAGAGSRLEPRRGSLDNRGDLRRGSLDRGDRRELRASLASHRSCELPPAPSRELRSLRSYDAESLEGSYELASARSSAGGLDSAPSMESPGTRRGTPRASRSAQRPDRGDAARCAACLRAP